MTEEEWREFKEAQKAEERAMDEWSRGREAGWDDWEEVHYGGAQ
jgi:hypothetical protein